MIRFRTYGTKGPPVVVVHGGPGTSGSMAAVAWGLADRFQVVGACQRGSGAGQRSSGAERLSVRRHVADLDEVIESCCGGGRPALVGSSWGAMLALAYAAEHPLVLIGCGIGLAGGLPGVKRELRGPRSWSSGLREPGSVGSGPRVGLLVAWRFRDSNPRKSAYVVRFGRLMSCLRPELGKPLMAVGTISNRVAAGLSKVELLALDTAIGCDTVGQSPKGRVG